MNPIDFLPDFAWSPDAEAEIAVTGPDLIRQSDFAFAIGTVAVAGLIYSSYSSPPWFWFALARNVKMSDLIDFRRLQESIPRGSLTAVREDFKVGRRFATFYGFEDTGGKQEHAGVTYIIYRRN
jgi:hypothetical protein